jgi:CRISPR system Cascade subunit CasE
MELDTRKRYTMKALNSPNLFHGAIEAAFPGERTRKLWRIDNLGGHCYILLLSDREPELEHAVEQFGVITSDKLWETKDYDGLLDRIEDHTIWRFRLTANPTKCSNPKHGERGTVQAHITSSYQKKWFMEKGEKCGFSVKEEDFLVTESCWKRFYKGAQRKQPVTFLAVTYEGILKVTDAEKFRKTLTDGVGRGKAFGMGMLTVMKAGAVDNG